MADPVLHHFATFRFAPAWWSAAPAVREAAWQAVCEALDRLPHAELYRLFPATAAADLLVWTAAPAADGAATGAALAALETALQPLRCEAEPVGALWGLTRPSLYVGRGSSHVMDPAGPRRPWLIVYPFTKTTEWYLLELEERRRLMGEHIAVGRQYPDIDQLLLYSHGLGDQDFVVAYETDEPARFSALVEALRATEVRRFTQSDTPVWVARHLPREAAGVPW